MGQAGDEVKWETLKHYENIEINIGKVYITRIKLKYLNLQGLENSSTKNNSSSSSGSRKSNFWRISPSPPPLSFNFRKMGISKTEINLRRLLSSAPQQQNQAKLVHYIATLREQLEQLAEERTADDLPRVSKALLNDYSEKIEAIASKLVDPLPEIKVPRETFAGGSAKESPSKADGEVHIAHSPGLRRRFAPSSNFEDRTRDSIQADASAPVKLDAAAQAHIEKHRKLQDDLTDEMVGLAQQLKESSLLMSQSLQNTEKILDSTEKAVEQSLASTGHASVRTMDIYSKTSKTTCVTWLVMFLMTCIFIMVVLLIRVT